MATTDGEIIGVAEEAPDLSDLTMVVVNVETRDGRQLSLVYGLGNETDRLSFTDLPGTDDSEHGYQQWRFAVTKTTE